MVKLNDLNENQKRALEIISDEGLDISICNDNFFIIGGWSDLEKLVQVFNNLDKPKQYGDLRVSSEGIALGDNDVYEKGNWLSDKISPPYKKPEGMCSIDDILGDYNWGFSDEHSCCGNCGNSIRTSPDSYAWIADFWITDGEIICGDCIRDSEDLIGEYIKQLINNPTNANTVLKEGTFENIGFKKCNCNDDECDFWNGLYEGANDDPKKILKNALERHPERDYVFDITDVGQFDIRFTLWNREKQVEEV